MLSFGVLIAFLSPKQSEIKESSLESMAKDVRTGRPDTPSEGGGTWVSMIRTTYPDRICYRPGCDDRKCRVLLPKRVWIGERATCPLGESGWSCSTDIPPRCLTSGILLRRHSIRIFHIRHFLRIFHTRRLTPDGRGGRFNFSGQTYPDPLIALTRRVL